MPISTFFFFSSAPSYWGKLLNLISKTTPQQQSEKRGREREMMSRRDDAEQSFLSGRSENLFYSWRTHSGLSTSPRELMPNWRIIAIKHSTLIGDLTSHSQSAFFLLTLWICKFPPFMSTASESDLSGSGDDSILTPCHVARSTRSTSLLRCD